MDYKFLLGYMLEREYIRLRKEAGEPRPWTRDPILNEYKFTNVNREDDRTTRWMRANWTGPNQDQYLDLQLFNCALFRYFGTSEFAEAVGWQHGFNPHHIIDVATERLAKGERVFTGAYVITNQGISAPKQEVVVNCFLAPLWDQLPRLLDTARDTKSWESVAYEMRKIPGFGGTGFMTKEVLLDAMQTPVLAGAVDQYDWTPVGPGARRGLNRLAGRPLKASMSEGRMLDDILWLRDKVQEEWPHGRLDAHTIQFCLCEVDKYLRVKNGEGRPRSKYK